MTFKFIDHRGEYTRTYTISQAIEFLVSPKPHFTRALHSIVLSMPWGKGRKAFELLDTAGLTNGIHQDEQVRKAMGQTLTAVREADLIFHLFDAAEIGKRDLLSAVSDVDYQVAQFGQMRAGYLVLANKMDLPLAKDGLRKLQDSFPGHVVIPISALYKTGFKEVKSFVRKHL